MRAEIGRIEAWGPHDSLPATQTRRGAEYLGNERGQLTVQLDP